MTYPDQTRFVARACAKLGYEFRDLDDGNGYLFSVSNGDERLVSGAGWICVYPINSAPSYEVSRDKHHTSKLLVEAAVPTIDGELYFTNDYHVRLRPAGREFSDALQSLEQRAFPVFCKPNAGSRGDFAEIVNSIGEFERYIDRVKRRYDAILIQDVIEGDEYRVFCVDDRVYFSAKRSDHRICGDGASDLRALVRTESLNLVGEGVSGVDVESTLRLLEEMYGLAPDRIVPLGEYVTLPGRRNISAGGAVEVLATQAPAELAEIALRACRAVGVRVGGVDVFDRSPRRDLSDLVVIEVNGNPAISSLSKMGRDELIDDIWSHVLQTYFAEAALRRRPQDVGV
jgi:cyanophycin synthetase